MAFIISVICYGFSYQYLDFFLKRELKIAALNDLMPDELT